MKSKPKCGRRKVWSNFPPASASFEKQGHNDIYMFAFLRSRTEGEVGEAPGHDPHTHPVAQGRGSVIIVLHREPWSEGQPMCFVCLKANSQLVGFVFPRKQTNDLLRDPNTLFIVPVATKWGQFLGSEAQNRQSAPKLLLTLLPAIFHSAQLKHGLLRKIPELQMLGCWFLSKLLRA